MPRLPSTEHSRVEFKGVRVLESDFAKVGWTGFSKIFHSPRIATDGTSKAAVCPAWIHSSPKRRSDSSLVACQFGGSAAGSSRAILISSGISPSIETKSVGWRFGSRFTNLSTGQEPVTLRHRRRVPRDYSSDLPRGAHPRQLRRQWRSPGGICARSAFSCTRHKQCGQGCPQPREPPTPYRAARVAARHQKPDLASGAMRRPSLHRQSFQRHLHKHGQGGRFGLIRRP